ARHFFGPQGSGAHHASDVGAGESSAERPLERGGATLDPSALAEWREFHEQIERLPDDQREAVNLLFYHELPHAHAGAPLRASVGPLDGRWRGARLPLHGPHRVRRPGRRPGGWLTGTPPPRPGTTPPPGPGSNCAARARSCRPGPSAPATPTWPARCSRSCCC